MFPEKSIIIRADKFHFDSKYGGLDTPYGSNNMKIAKEGSLNVWITWKR